MNKGRMGPTNNYYEGIWDENTMTISVCTQNFHNNITIINVCHHYLINTNFPFLIAHSYLCASFSQIIMWSTYLSIDVLDSSDKRKAKTT